MSDTLEMETAGNDQQQPPEINTKDKPDDEFDLIKKRGPKYFFDDSNDNINFIEKSLEYSDRLECKRKSIRSQVKKYNKLANEVEDFAFRLLDPLKEKRGFEISVLFGVRDKALKHRRKKFVSHPVLIDLMAREWMGVFHEMAECNNKLKWYLFNVCIFFEAILFPVVPVLLLVIHLIISLINFAKKKRQELRVVFLFNASWKYADVQLCAMQRTAKYIMQKIQSDRTQCDTITRDCDGSILTTFTSSADAIKMPDVKDVKYHTRQVSKDKDIMGDEGFLDCLEIAKNLFENTEESKKVLVVMTDDKLGAPSIMPLKSIKQDQNVKVISVGLGVHPEIKELETIATNEEDVFLIFNDNSNVDEKKMDDILECIKEKYIYDRYVQYFNTPYVIFFRDTLSYLALLGFHVVVCLQPSTLHFTAVEWIISGFFLGRFMMEINQLIKELNCEQKEEEKEKICQKLKKATQAYFRDWWNILDIVTLIVFLVLFGLRAFIWSQHSSVSKNRLLAVTEYLYGLNAMVLTLRVFGHIMEYIESTGSIQIALFNMIGAAFVVIGQFAATTLAFSLAITKIYIAEVSYSSGNNEKPTGFCKSKDGLKCWWSFISHLAWSLLGFTDLTTLQSSDNAADNLSHILYGLFLIIGAVMLMNMMIALLSNTYQQVEDNSFYEWSFKKATTIRTYSKYHPVPVPFNILSLAFILIRYICRKIICIKCCNAKPKKDQDFQTPMLRMTVMEENRTRNEKPGILSYLEAKYVAKFGYMFPEPDKIDLVWDEIEGNRTMNRNFAEHAFCFNQKDVHQLESHGDHKWESNCITVVGQRLTLRSSREFKVDRNGIYGARYLNPLSKENPEFEVLIKETAPNSRIIGIGIVTEDYNLNMFPGLEGNTVGFHIDDGKIFDRKNPHLGKGGDDAKAYIGDTIGCEILYDKQKDGKLPVSFTLNGRFVGEAELNCHPGHFYPYIGIASEGISLLFRMGTRVSQPRVKTNRKPETSSELHNIIQRHVRELERKLIDELSRSSALEGKTFSN